jgi:hypothetical protein
MDDMDDMDEEGTQNLKLLKVIVVTLGILIVIMLAVIVGTVIYRMSQGDNGEAAMQAPSSVRPDLPVPPGSTLRAMTPSDRELYLHVRDGAGGDHVYALDRKTGALLWHRRLVPDQ